MPEAKETTVHFQEMSDLSIIGVVHPKTQESMAEITGYNLDVKFNMALINTPEDIDNVAQGLADAFKEMLLDNLINKG